jgi:hypothetical protein
MGVTVIVLHSGELSEPLFDPGLEEAREHLCRLKAWFTICKNRLHRFPGSDL